MSAGEDRALTQVLQRVAQEATPARLPADLWSRGRRGQRRRTATAVAMTAALLAVMALPVVMASGWQQGVPADDQPVIPTRVQGPRPFQSTVQEAPPGPAALIVTGPGGFGASDFFGYEDRALVVGRNGSYRMVRHVNAFDAGETLLLSPGGRYIAGDSGIEGARPGDVWIATAVVDLTTGQVQTYDAGRPLAWSPDGHSLLASSDAGILSIVDMYSGGVIKLGLFGADPSYTTAAFSPDGRRVAVQVGPTLRVVDIVARAYRDLVRLGDRRVLAGPGSWTPDGRIAILNLIDCGTPCQTPGTVGFEFTYVDAELGTYTDGPRLARFHATGASLLGWQNDGDAVVVLNRDFVPPPAASVPAATAPEVVALHPGGGSTTLMSLPGDANRVDISRDLLDRFGGAPVSPTARFLDWLRPLLDEIAPLVAAAATIYGLRLVRRRVRTGFWRRHPGGTRHWAE